MEKEKNNKGLLVVLIIIIILLLCALGYLLFGKDLLNKSSENNTIPTTNNIKSTDELYNEYLQLKKERDEQCKDESLPSLLPRFDDDEEEEKQDDEKKNNHFKRKINFRGPPIRRRMRTVGGYRKNYNNGMKKRGGYEPKFRGRRYKKNYYS